MEEIKIDNQLKEIDNSSYGHNPFEILLNRKRLRPKYEQLGKDYITILNEGYNSNRTNLKILHILDRLRSPDIANQSLRFAKIGQNKRRIWERKNFDNTEYNTNFSNLKKTNTKSLRSFKSSYNNGLMDAVQSETYLIDHKRETNASDKPIIDFSKTLTLHLGFIDENLIVSLDSNLDEFIYGKESISTDKKIKPKAFSEYKYDGFELDPSKIVSGPNVIKNVKTKIKELTEKLHSFFDEYPGLTFPSNYFLEIIEKLEELIGYKKLKNDISFWAQSKNYSLDEIFLIIAPDDHLFLLPLGFMGSTTNEPLITEIGGVSTILSLMAFKWKVKDYHWVSSVNMSSLKPKCTFFSSNGIPELNLHEEALAISENFGVENVRLFCENATKIDFLNNYSAGDVCWFSGHGSFDLSQGVELENEMIPFPMVGPVFKDGMLSNFDLIYTSNWNFKAMWLTVMNCCVIGKSVVFGPNPLGFISSMHSVGNNSLIAPLWPILDTHAISFAKLFSKNLVNFYGDSTFPRARAFKKTIKDCLKQKQENIVNYAAYTFWGNL